MSNSDSTKEKKNKLQYTEETNQSVPGCKNKIYERARMKNVKRHKM